MGFRFKAFGLHLLGSACLLALVLGGLYLGWYRWPGWYLAGAARIALMMAGIDVVLGPLLTLLIANPSKPRRELARDVGMIVVVQLIAAGYGFATLWGGRPLYYTYSEKYLQMVQASDLRPEQIELGRKLNPSLAPHWYSLPRWIYAPLPKDKELARQIMGNSITGGDDVVQMPQYYKPWPEAEAEIRKNLKQLDKIGSVMPHDRKIITARMKERGYAPEQPILLPVVVRSKPMVAVVDPLSAQIKEFIAAQ